MKKITTYLLLGGSLLAGVISVQADTFSNDGGDTLFHNPANWNTGVVPASSAAVAGSFNANLTCDFNAATWSYLSANSKLRTSTEYRGINRLLTGDVRATRTQVINLDYGDANLWKATGGTAMYIANKTGVTTTLNLISGAVNLESNPLRLGNEANSYGILNISGGQFIIGRNDMYVGVNGSALVKITGGSFRTRDDINIGSLGTFEVSGTGATEIGIGSFSSVDGRWTQSGTLSVLVDETATGVTKILVDETDGIPGVGNDGNVIFQAGSLLDVDFAGAYTNGGTFTVMEWEGTLTDNGLAFSTNVNTEIWSFNLDAANKVLTVTADGGSSPTEPTVVPNITDASYSNTTVTLTWDSESGVGYNVLSASNLVDVAWSTNVAGVTGDGASTTTNLTAGGGPQEFYKIEAFGQ
ncbi:autotransporter outer membrane beta-barrel domain-containing protein [Pontiella desulfatans]|nr:hypothetical protein [Pontiella desulfatans]